MAVAPERQATLEEFLGWPEQKPALEFADGIDLTGILPGFQLTVEELFSALRIE